MEIVDIRLTKIKELISNMGSQVEFAARIKRKPQQVSSWLKQEKPVGEKIARHIERELGLEAGYLDKPEPGKLLLEVAKIPLYPSRFSSNNNDILKETKIGKIPFSLIEIEKAAIKVENLISLMVESNSMQYTINEGSIVIVDVSQKEIIDNKIYAFTTSKQSIIQIKRLRTGTDSVIIQPDNKEFSEEKVLHSSKTKLEIIGRVLWVSNRLI